MKIFSILILSAGLALVLSAPQEISAQPGYPGYSSGSRYRKSSRKEKKSKRTKKDSKKSKGEEEKPPMKAGSGQESINSYVKARLKELQTAKNNQTSFGRRMSNGWTAFWQQAYNDRKAFDLNIARQRIDHFKTLDSIDESDHRQAMADFDRLQTNLIKSFEASHRRRIEGFFDQLARSLKDFQAEQLKWNVEFMQAGMDAWDLQKKK